MKESTQKNVDTALQLFKQNVSYKEIAKQMNRPEGTIRRWLAPYNLFGDVKEYLRECCKKGNTKLVQKYELLRKECYDLAKKNANKDLEDYLLRDFINIYIGEGDKRNRDRVSIVNSDPKIVLLSLIAIKKYFLKEGKNITLGIRYYKENNNEQELLEYWKQITNNDPVINYKTYLQPTVKATGHNNSNKFGLVFVAIHDTYAKQKMDAYMDYLKEEWTKEFEIVFDTKVDRSITEIKAANNC